MSKWNAVLTLYLSTVSFFVSMWFFVGGGEVLLYFKKVVFLFFEDFSKKCHFSNLVRVFRLFLCR